MAEPQMLFHLTLKDTDLRAALADVFAQAGRGFTFDDMPDGVVTVHADDLNFRDTLKLLLPTGFEAVESPDGLYHIRRTPEAAQERDAA